MTSLPWFSLYIQLITRIAFKVLGSETATVRTWLSNLIFGVHASGFQLLSCSGDHTVRALYLFMLGIRSTPIQYPKANKLARLALLSRMPGYGSYSDANSQHMFPGFSRNRSYIPNYGFVDVNTDTYRPNHQHQHHSSGGGDYSHSRHYHRNNAQDYYEHRDRRYPYRDQGDSYREHSDISQEYRARSPPNMDRRDSRSPTRRISLDDYPNNRSSSPRRPPTGPKAYREHDNTPVPPPPPQKPSDEYLAIASQSPKKLSESSDSTRKLLIMDLNGTLLHRAAPPKRKDFPAVDDRPRDSNGRPLPRLRPVHPRPYMPAFRNYLFAQETKQWLDAMIWSSAQPHSVDDMVQKTLGDFKDELLTIWARDTLGLTDEHYGMYIRWSNLSVVLNV